MDTVQRLRAVVTGIEHYLNLWTPKIQCDTCGTQYIAHGLHGWDSVHFPDKVDRVIRDNGWHVQDGRHTCPECLPT
jgi:hypothetical protein